MNTMLDELVESDSFLKLLDANLKVTLLLSALLLGIAVMRLVFKTSAARRASALLLGVSLVPVIVITSFAIKSEKSAIWTVDGASSPVVDHGFAFLPDSDLASSSDSTLSPNASESHAASSESRSSPPEPAGSTPKESSETKPDNSVSLEWWILIIWLTGTALMMARLWFGVLVLNWRVHRIASVVDSGPLADALVERCAKAGVPRVPRLFIAEEQSLMPMTWGVHRHKIMLPSEARSWSHQHLGMVLHHELAHIKRHDCVGTWLTRLLLAPLWFHPLAWVVARVATDLRERACDDAVTRQLPDPDSYAYALVACSRRYLPISGSLAMARPRRLEARIRAMYGQELGRSEATWSFRGSVALLLTLVLAPMLFFTACQTTTPAEANKAPEVSVSTKSSTGGKVSIIAKPSPAGGLVTVAEVVKEPPGRLLLEQTVTPAPSYAPGDKKVILRHFHVFFEKKMMQRDLEGPENLLEPEKVQRRFALEHLPNGIPGKRKISRAWLKELKKEFPRSRSFDLSRFSTGKPYATKNVYLETRPINPKAVAANDDWTIWKYSSRKRETTVEAKVQSLPSGKIEVDVSFQKASAKLRTPVKVGGQAVWKPYVKGEKFESGKLVIENGGAVLVGEPREWKIDVMNTALWRRALLALLGEEYPYDMHFVSLAFLEIEVVDP